MQVVPVVVGVVVGCLIALFFHDSPEAAATYAGSSSGRISSMIAIPISFGVGGAVFGMWRVREGSSFNEYARWTMASMAAFGLWGLQVAFVQGTFVPALQMLVPGFATGVSIAITVRSIR